MTRTYKATGMTCKTCQTNVQNLLSQITGVKNVSVNLASREVKIEMNEHLPTSLFKEALNSYPQYQIMEEKVLLSEQGDTTTPWLRTYQPLLLIIAYLFFASLITSFKNDSLNVGEWMNSFMAGFFLTFSFFKLLNLSDFATSYAMYDIVAKQLKGYGLLYPFIELALGIAYLTHFNPVFTNIATIIIMGIGSIGVIQSVMNKQVIQCACLGTVFKLPMSTVTIIENIAMIAMALIGLITID